MAEAAERRQGSSSAGSLRVHTERLHQRRQVMGSLDTEHHALAGDDARHVEIHQPAAAVPPCTADRVNINVTRIITGHSRVFGVKGTQKLAKLMRTYRVHEEREGRTMPEVALTTYLYNGRAVLPTQTPHELGMVCGQQSELSVAEPAAEQAARAAVTATQPPAVVAVAASTAASTSAAAASAAAAAASSSASASAAASAPVAAATYRSADVLGFVAGNHHPLNKARDLP